MNLAGHLPEIPGVIVKKSPEDSAKRKGMPLWQGVFMYFPDALLAVAEHSRKANDKHNPGQPIHWSRPKSPDHADCITRHLIDMGPNWTEMDPEFDTLHAAALAWRALAVLQIAIERRREMLAAQNGLLALHTVQQTGNAVR